MAEHRRPGDEDRGPGGRALGSVGDVDAAVHLDLRGQAAPGDLGAQRGHLVERVGDQALAAEAGVDGHHQGEVADVEDVVELGPVSYTHLTLPTIYSV